MSKNRILRKFIATIFSSLLFSGFMALGSSTMGNPGLNYLFFSAIFFVYAGVIIFVYGNIVSNLLEWVFDRFFRPSKLASVCYILFHGIFGSLIGLIDLNLSIAIMGFIAALLYGFIDFWINLRQTQGRTLKPITLLLVMFLIPSIVLGFFSDTIDPFTEEEALDFVVTLPEYDGFPNKAGRWELTIHGFHVVRETIVKKKDDGTYHITLKETGTRGEEKTNWEVTYRVERGASWLEKGEPSIRPHYSKEGAGLYRVQ
ncbi:hypothetical protein AWM68_17630 [Fictibacillus phosphorivorans]|uniref:Uncharacterized protein n=1 Tax=Fictibacillus phosphorivorans TaxID=1221500 RepID=A0A163S251_9BACL|nr:hypothetical protein [Fictibacillus phosphorivorans]KZE67992.1 hypothetical protein AWM68_17630 [Fictibacillus phosphorivorans]